MWSPELRWLALLLLLAASAGCGFHLRGEAPLSERMRAPFLEMPDHYTRFHAELTRSLQSAGATLAGAPETASAIVRVHVDESGREVLSISARNTPQEYEVYYRVEYSVSAGGEEILPRQRLTLTRDYAYDETAVLAMEHEEHDILDALARDLAALVTRRLAAL